MGRMSLRMSTRPQVERAEEALRLERTHQSAGQAPRKGAECASGGGGRLMSGPLPYTEAS